MIRTPCYQEGPETGDACTSRRRADARTGWLDFDWSIFFHESSVRSCFDKSNTRTGRSSIVVGPAACMACRGRNDTRQGAPRSLAAFASAESRANPWFPATIWNWRYKRRDLNIANGQKSSEKHRKDSIKIGFCELSFTTRCHERLPDVICTSLEGGEGP